jgi:ferredoxin-NADP reductase
MKELSLKFSSRIQRTRTVASFRFIPPEKVDFSPGQFLELIFDKNNKSNRQLNKYLSFSSSPTKDYIEVTKRLSESQFSNKLMSLKNGEPVLVKLPLGNCIFKEEYKKIAFLIGGIGITPVISILEYINDKKLDTDALLFYSNRSDDDIGFRKEIDEFAALNKNIKVVYTVTDCESKDKKCIFGFINKDLITKRIDDFSQRMVFIYGPPSMVKAMQDICCVFNCAKNNVKTESFLGY